MSSRPVPELFRHFPELRRGLPWTPLARPTPVQALPKLESFARAAGIWIKRDDLTSDIHGGSAARELEFVFGDVLRRGVRRLVAFGSAGSGTCLAVTAFAHHFRLRTVLALVGGAEDATVQRTLQLEHALGAELHRVDGGPRALWRLLGSSLSEVAGGGPRLPYLLLPRRAALLGALGCVNAAYELKRQISTGVLPLPRRIYLAAGSGATFAGMALGCELAGIQAALVGVVAPGRHAPSPHRLVRRTARFLRRRTKQFPSRRGRVSVELRSLDREDWNGSHGAGQVQGLLRELEGIDLERTQASAAMAALLDDCRIGRARGPVLLWNTHSPDVLVREPSTSTAALPGDLREFFVAR